MSTNNKEAADTLVGYCAAFNCLRRQRNYTKNTAKFIQNFDRSLLPSPEEYYLKQFGKLRIKSDWEKVLCPFHDDHTPSLSINLVFGGFRCFVCDAHGKDVLAFQMQRYNQSFKQAAIELGAWRDWKCME